MNFKKAVVSAIVLYALVFLAACVLMFVLTGLAFDSAMVVVGAVLTFLVSKHFYFNKIKVKKPVVEGLKLGMVFAITSFLIETLVMVYGFAASQGWNYFLTWHMLLGYVLMLVVPVFAVRKSR
jgi:hypothetical protein